MKKNLILGLLTIILGSLTGCYNFESYKKYPEPSFLKSELK